MWNILPPDSPDTLICASLGPYEDKWDIPLTRYSFDQHT